MFSQPFAGHGEISVAVNLQRDVCGDLLPTQ